MSANVNLSEVQEKVDDSAKQAKRFTHKVSLAALGLAGLTYDAGKAAFHSADGFLTRAERRGEEIEAMLNERAAQVQQQLDEEAKSRKAQVEGTLSSISEGIGERGKSLEKSVKSGLSSLKIGSGTVVETDQIRIEVEVVESEPWENYESLNAQEVIDRLHELDKAQLMAVSEYEARTKNRVTVLREIEMRLAGLEETSPPEDAGVPPM